MKLAGCVVLYNPGENIFENIQTYLPIVEKLYVMDNSTEELPFLEKFKNLDKKIEYVSFGGNKGLTYAHKLAVDMAIASGYDAILSIDQDSEYPLEDFPIIVNYINTHDMSNIAQIGLNYPGNRTKPKGSKDEVVEVISLITSGTITFLAPYKKILGYEKDLFIDYMDFDLSCQFKEKGFTNLMFKNIVLDHNLGTVKTYNILGFKVSTHIWPAFRQYYMFRNLEYLKRNRSKEYLKYFNKNSGVNFWVKWLRILTQKPHKEMYRMIKWGQQDGKAGILGPFDETTHLKNTNKGKKKKNT